MLHNAITLNFPVPDAPLAITTDASKVCLGATLDQFVEGVWKPLGLWSKTLKPEQQRYTTYTRELLAIKIAIRNFIDEIQGRRLTIFTDHRPILGSWKNPDLQAHDPVALNAINEIVQHTSDIRFRPGKQLIVADLLSRPFGLEGQKFASPMAKEPEYVAPELTLAALQEVSLSVVSPEAIAEDQKNCPDVKLHQEGKCPKGVKMQDV